jgi:LmbE family N-acetylglucosaminyl deacetylase
MRGGELMIGNGDGLGHVREEELYRAYERLGVSPENVTVLDDPYVLLILLCARGLMIDAY